MFVLLYDIKISSIINTLTVMKKGFRLKLNQ